MWTDQQIRKLNKPTVHVFQLDWLLNAYFNRKEIPLPFVFKRYTINLPSRLNSHQQENSKSDPFV